MAVLVVHIQQTSDAKATLAQFALQKAIKGSRVTILFIPVAFTEEKRYLLEMIPT